MKLPHRMMLAAATGVILGRLIDPTLATSLVPLGNIYLSLLKMVALPLIFFSLIHGMTSLVNVENLYKMGARSLMVFVATGIVAALIGIGVSLFVLDPAHGTILQERTSSFSLKSLLATIFPDNFLGAFTRDSTIQVTLLALLMSMATLGLPNEDKQTIIKCIRSIQQLFLNIMKFIMLLSPISIMIFTAHMTANVDKDALHILFRFAFSITIAYLIQYIILGLYIRCISRLPCLPFFSKSIEYQIIALTTGSSKATLPYTIQVAKNKLGISDQRASFVLPLGATINMDGLSIYLTLSTLFFVQAAGIHFSIQDYGILIVASSCMAIGTAGIPGGALAVLPMILGIWDLPHDYLPLFIAIDPLINMFRSTLNITGDVAVTLVLDRLHGDLEIETYKAKEI